MNLWQSLQCSSRCLRPVYSTAAVNETERRQRKNQVKKESNHRLMCGFIFGV